jgi:peptidoglycan hydrolase-like protein with peptidoglycan-binding domain
LFGRGKRTSTLKQRPTHHARSPDQSLSSVQKGEDMPRQSYIDSEQDLQKGSVDDRGDAKYVRLEQNVPDGFVYDLQTDLYGMGFTILEEADGAFGQQTEKAVKQFQERAKIPQNGIVDHVTKNEIMTWLNHGYTKKNPPPKETPTKPANENGVTLITPRVQHYSQGDARWAGRVLGSSSTIQRKGCAITSIAMILKFFGRNVTPGTLDKYLDQEDGYSGNCVKWAVAAKHGQARGARLKYKNKTGKEKTLQQHLAKRIRKNLPTMVRVDYKHDADITYNHFVVCVGQTSQGHFVMNDPATCQGDGYCDLCDDNIIEKTSRKEGYKIVQLDWYEQA